MPVSLEDEGREREGGDRYGAPDIAALHARTQEIDG
jgi:hypothetical protein